MSRTAPSRFRTASAASSDGQLGRTRRSHPSPAAVEEPSGCDGGKGAGGGAEVAAAPTRAAHGALHRVAVADADDDDNCAAAAPAGTRRRGEVAAAATRVQKTLAAGLREGRSGGALAFFIRGRTKSSTTPASAQPPERAGRPRETRKTRAQRGRWGVSAQSAQPMIERHQSSPPHRRDRQQTLPRPKTRRRQRAAAAAGRGSGLWLSSRRVLGKANPRARPQRLPAPAAAAPPLAPPPALPTARGARRRATTTPYPPPTLLLLQRPQPNAPAAPPPPRSLPRCAAWAASRAASRAVARSRQAESHPQSRPANAPPPPRSPQPKCTSSRSACGHTTRRYNHRPSRASAPLLHR